MADQQQKQQQQHKQDKQKIDQQQAEEDDLGCVRDIELTDDHTLVSRAFGAVVHTTALPTNRWFQLPHSFASILDSLAQRRTCMCWSWDVRNAGILTFCSFDCCLLPQHVAEQHALENDCGCVVWDAALVLVNYLVKQAELGALNLSGKRVIELGAGTGAAQMLLCMPACFGHQVHVCMQGMQAGMPAWICNFVAGYWQRPCKIVQMG
jgi:hypothetical protein